MENHIESLDGFSLIDSGHVLGSKGLFLLIKWIVMERIGSIY